MASLEECWTAYRLCGEWPLVGQTLVKMAHCFVEDDPGRRRSASWRELASMSLRETWPCDPLRSASAPTVSSPWAEWRRRCAPSHEAEALTAPPRSAERAAWRATFLAARLLESLGPWSGGGDASSMRSFPRSSTEDTFKDRRAGSRLHLRIPPAARLARAGSGVGSACPPRP